MNTKIESDKFRNKYRISPQRLKGYDYSQNGMYLVTICTKNREHFCECWSKKTEHFSFVQLADAVVMPDHVHGILIIDMPENPAETKRSSEVPMHAKA